VPRYLIGIVLALAIAPAGDAHAAIVSGTIDAVSPEAALSLPAFRQTVTFDIVFTCTARAVADIDAFLFQAVGGRRFGAGALFRSGPIPCSGEAQTVTLTAPATNDPPFLLVPGTAAGQVNLTVCDPALDACEVVDRMAFDVRLVPAREVASATT
jgi:hypothetical protein